MESDKKYTTEQRIFYQIRGDREKLAGMALEDDVGSQVRSIAREVVKAMAEALNKLDDLRQSKLKDQ